MHMPAPLSGTRICLGAKNKHFGILLCSFSHQTPLGSHLHVIKEWTASILHNSVGLSLGNQGQARFSPSAPHDPPLFRGDRLPVANTQATGQLPRSVTWGFLAPAAAVWELGKGGFQPIRGPPHPRGGGEGKAGEAFTWAMVPDAPEAGAALTGAKQRRAGRWRGRPL